MSTATATVTAKNKTATKSPVKPGLSPVRRYTLRQALLIALQGVMRMYQSFYFATSHGDCRYTVTKPDGTEYEVVIMDDGVESIGYCSCPFSDYGQANPTCKHQEFTRSFFGLYRSDMEIEFAPMLE